MSTTQLSRERDTIDVHSLRIAPNARPRGRTKHPLRLLGERIVVCGASIWMFACADSLLSAPGAGHSTSPQPELGGLNRVANASSTDVVRFAEDVAERLMEGKCTSSDVHALGARLVHVVDWSAPVPTNGADLRFRLRLDDAHLVDPSAACLTVARSVDPPDQVVYSFEFSLIPLRGFTARLSKESARAFAAADCSAVFATRNGALQFATMLVQHRWEQSDVLAESYAREVSIRIGASLRATVAEEEWRPLTLQSSDGGFGRVSWTTSIGAARHTVEDSNSEDAEHLVEILESIREAIRPTVQSEK